MINIVGRFDCLIQGETFGVSLWNERVLVINNFLYLDHKYFRGQKNVLHAITFYLAD
jgi:hypothetical protein